MLFNHRINAVQPPHTRRRSTHGQSNGTIDQDRSTGKRAQLKPIKTSTESTSGFIGVDPSTGRHPSSIHRRLGLILLLPLLDEGRRVIERDEEESERERGRYKILIKKSLNTWTVNSQCWLFTVHMLNSHSVGEENLLIKVKFDYYG